MFSVNYLFSTIFYSKWNYKKGESRVLSPCIIYSNNPKAWQNSQIFFFRFQRHVGRYPTKSGASESSAQAKMPKIQTEKTKGSSPEEKKNPKFKTKETKDLKSNHSFIQNSLTTQYIQESMLGVMGWGRYKVYALKLFKVCILVPVYTWETKYEKDKKWGVLEHIYKARHV